MGDKDNGGPAFPYIVPDMPIEAIRPGMTLRDWFAGQAPDAPKWWFRDMPVPPPGWSEGDGEEKWYAAQIAWQLNRLAIWRWSYADAMLEARNG